jgi:hypothetical protein
MDINPKVMLMSEMRKGWVPFFKEGMDPRALHQEYRKKILDLLMRSEKPLNPSKIAETFGMAGVTASKTSLNGHYTICCRC